MATKSLYVGNISYNVTEEELKSLFAPWGPVSEARIVQGRGFGFVDVPEENAATAIAETNGKDHMGRTITVSEARPKTEGGNRGGGGGYGGGNRGGGGYGGGNRGGGGYGGGSRW
jgi:RNA recognition motif-containing protein